MAKRPRFPSSSWDPTPEEDALMRAAREQYVRVRKERSRLDALEQEALTVAASVAQAQMDRCGSDSDYMLPVRSLAAELGAAVRESSTRVQHKMFDALVLTARFPATTLALQEARITGRHAGIIREYGERLPDGDLLAEYERQAVFVAEDTTPAQLRVFVKTLADRLLPESLTDRHERARATRGAWVRDLDDGMAEISLVHTATVVHGIHDRLTQMGKTVESVERRREREAREARDADDAARRAARADAQREEFRAAVARIAEHGHHGLRHLSELPDGDAAGRESGAAPPRDAFGRVLDREDDPIPDARFDTGPGSRTRNKVPVPHDATSPAGAPLTDDAAADAIEAAGADETGPATDTDTTPQQAPTDPATAPPADTAEDADADTATAATTPEPADPAPESGTNEDTAADTEAPDAAATDAADVPVSRTLDEVRADIAADLLLSGLPTAHTVCDETGKNVLDAIRASVQVTIPAAIITRGPADKGACPVDGSAFLAGYGPIDPDTARHLAGRAPGWDRLFRDPGTGVLLTIDRYTPSEQQKRFLLARDETCRFPCCRVPARRADSDHTVDWQHGGETNVANLATLCRAHHMVKHHSPWTVTQRDGGVLEWSSPLGHTYVDLPQPTVRFTAATDTATTDTGPPDPLHPPPF